MSVRASDHDSENTKICTTSTTVSNGLPCYWYTSVGQTNTNWLHWVRPGCTHEAHWRLQDSPIGFRFRLQVCHVDLSVEDTFEVFYSLSARWYREIRFWRQAFAIEQLTTKIVSYQSYYVLPKRLFCCHPAIALHPKNHIGISGNTASMACTHIHMGFYDRSSSWHESQWHSIARSACWRLWYIEILCRHEISVLQVEQTHYPGPFCSSECFVLYYRDVGKTILELIKSKMTVHRFCSRMKYQVQHKPSCGWREHLEAWHAREILAGTAGFP